MLQQEGRLLILKPIDIRIENEMYSIYNDMSRYSYVGLLNLMRTKRVAIIFENLLHANEASRTLLEINGTFHQNSSKIKALGTRVKLSQRGKAE